MFGLIPLELTLECLPTTTTRSYQDLHLQLQSVQFRKQMIKVSPIFGLLPDPAKYFHRKTEMAVGSGNIYLSQHRPLSLLQYGVSVGPGPSPATALSSSRLSFRM